MINLLVTSGIRVGTAAINKGSGRKDMKTVVEFIDEALKSHENPQN